MSQSNDLSMKNSKGVDLKVDHRVTYTTTGRYPKKVAGKITGFTEGWVCIRCDDGQIRKSRPGPLHHP